MASLNIFNSFILNNLGQNWEGFQGPTTGSAGTALNIGGISGITLSGFIYTQQGQVATATATKLYDSSVNLPATANYIWLWCDQTYYVQLITSATSVALGPFPATTPFAFPGYQMLAAASTSAISTTPPSTTAIAKIYLGNYSGNVMNYQLNVVL